MRRVTLVMLLAAVTARCYVDELTHHIDVQMAASTGSMTMPRSNTIARPELQLRGLRKIVLPHHECSTLTELIIGKQAMNIVKR